MQCHFPFVPGAAPLCIRLHRQHHRELLRVLIDVDVDVDADANADSCIRIACMQKRWECQFGGTFRGEARVQNAND